MRNTSLLSPLHLLVITATAVIKYDDKKNDFTCTASGTGIGPILQVIDHYCDDHENSDIKESMHSRQRIYFGIVFVSIT